MLKASSGRFLLRLLLVRSLGIDLRANACVHGALRQLIGEQQPATIPPHRCRGPAKWLDGHSATCTARMHTHTSAARIAPLRHAWYKRWRARVRTTRREASGLTRTCRDTYTASNSTNAPPLTPLRTADLHERRCACALATTYLARAHAH